MPNDRAEFQDEIANEGREVATSENAMVGLIAAAEIDQQIATAHKYPRSLAIFRREALQMVTLTEVIAQECIYALKRGDKTIQGPSARFAEIIFSAWGNARAGARIVHTDTEFVVAQGVCQDLQRNTAITFEVSRRITDSKGKRYNADMIGVTSNAASSIALRNSILKVVPKAFWSELYTAALKVGVGDVKTLANKRVEAIAAFQHYGVSEAQILAKLGRSGVQDIGLDDLMILFGLLTAIKDNETTPEDAFAVEGNSAAPSQSRPKSDAKPEYPADQFAKNLAGWRDMIAKGKKKPEEIVTMLRSKNTLTEQQEAAIREPISNPDDPAPPEALALMRSKAEAGAISDDDIKKHLKLKKLDGLTVAQVNAALAFIADPAGASK